MSPIMHAGRAGSSSAQSHEDAAVTEMPPSKRRKKGHSMEAMLAREVGLMRDGSGDASASFVGSASGIHFIRAVYGAIGSAAQEHTSPIANLVPGEDDRLGSSAQNGPICGRHIWNQREVYMGNDLGTTNAPSFEDLLDWTETFFDNWHPPFPVLHAPSILSTLEKLAENGLASLAFWDAVIVRAILSLSVADRRQSSKPLPRPISGELVFTTFDQAHEAILPALTRPATIHSLQAVICVQLFLVSMLRLNTASRLSGLIVQMAFQLGLHRCPMRYQAFSKAERQLRKRIFWSMYCIERYICQAMGLPLTLRDEDADVCPLDKEVHHLKSPDHPPSFHTENETERESMAPPDGRLQLLAFLSQHAQLRGSIIELRNKRVEERDKDPDAAVLINAKLVQWWNEVEDFLDQKDEIDSPVSPLHRVVLKTLKHESTIMLHRPMLASPKATATYSNAVHACIGAAKSLLSGLYMLAAESQLCTGTTSCTPMMWPSFTWAVWMSAFILLYATSEGLLTEKVAGRNVDRSLQILNRLAARGSVWPEASAVAIQDLRSILSGRNDQPKTPSSALEGEGTERARNTNAPSSALNQRTRPITGVAPTSSHGLVSEPAAQHLPRAQIPTALANVRVAGPTAASEQDGTQLQDMDRHQQPQVLGTHLEKHAASNVDSMYSTATNFDSAWSNMDFLPKDVPPMAFGSGDPFQGFDIPFWFGQDNYVAWMENET